MADLDDHQAVAGETQQGATFVNSLDSHSRLQAILDKCKAGQTARLFWCVQGIWVHAKKGNLKSLSNADIKGTQQTGGYIDLLAYKQDLRGILFLKAGTECQP